MRPPCAPASSRLPLQLLLLVVVVMAVSTAAAAAAFLATGSTRAWGLQPALKRQRQQQHRRGGRAAAVVMRGEDKEQAIEEKQIREKQVGGWVGASGNWGGFG